MEIPYMHYGELIKMARITLFIESTNNAYLRLSFLSTLLPVYGLRNTAGC
jgi:hypothetical protein